MDLLSNLFLYISSIGLLFIFSLTGLVLLHPILETFEDKGFAFSKLFMILIISYLTWIGVSIKIFTYSYTYISILTLILLLSSLSYLFLRRKTFINFFKIKWRLILFEEILFWIAFIIFLTIRYFNPDLWHPIMGGEKPMDFAFINAIVRTTSLPPFDPWFSGNTINYYYYGQFIVATMIKLTKIPSSIFYNIAIAFLFSQTIIGGFSLTLWLTKSKFKSLFGGIFIAGIGNLAQIPLIVKSFSQLPPINAWYWNATRVMPNYEINEFPFFTFLYADLHSHLIALPIALFSIGLSLSMLEGQTVKKILLKASLLGITFGIIRATNTWDYPTYFLSFVTLISIAIFKNKKHFFSNLIKYFSVILLSLTSSIISILPFILSYKTGPLGLSIYEGKTTQITDFFLIHGFFIFIIFSFFVSVFNFKKVFKKRKTFPFLLLLLIIVPLILIKSSFLALLIILLIGTILSFISISKKLFNTRIICAFIFLATILCYIPDILDIKLGLGRMNTVFKFYFQAWIFFALASAAALPVITNRLKNSYPLIKYAWYVLFIVLFISSFIYVPTATLAKTTDRMSMFAPHTLDGSQYMSYSTYFDAGKQLSLIWDYKAISFINQYIKGNPTIVEGFSPIYRWGARISVYTGLPTVVGWDWHEKAHRSYLPFSDIDERVKDVNNIYNTTDINLLRMLLIKYNISYVYVGELEKAYYNPLGIEKFEMLNNSLFTIVYKNEGSTFYKVDKNNL